MEICQSKSIEGIICKTKGFNGCALEKLLTRARAIKSNVSTDPSTITPEEKEAIERTLKENTGCHKLPELSLKYKSIPVVPTQSQINPDETIVDRFPTKIIYNSKD